MIYYTRKELTGEVASMRALVRKKGGQRTRVIGWKIGCPQGNAQLVVTVELEDGTLDELSRNLSNPDAI